VVQVPGRPALALLRDRSPSARRPHARGSAGLDAWPAIPSIHSYHCPTTLRRLNRLYHARYHTRCCAGIDKLPRPGECKHLLFRESPIESVTQSRPVDASQPYANGSGKPYYPTLGHARDTLLPALSPSNTTSTPAHIRRLWVLVAIRRRRRRTCQDAFSPGTLAAASRGAGPGVYRHDECGVAIWHGACGNTGTGLSNRNRAIPSVEDPPG
jgi:hypothetical protein